MGNATYFRCRYFTAYSFGCMAVVAWCGISSVWAQAPAAPPTEGGAGSGGGVALGAEEAPQDTSDVRAILAKVRAEYEGIYAYRMTIKWHQRQFPETSLHLPLPLGELLSEGEGEWIEDGARWRVHQWRRNQQTYLMMGKPMTPAKRKMMPVDVPFQYWAAFDGANYANRSTQHGEDFLMYFPKATLEAQGDAMVGPNLYPFPLKLAFGTGHNYLEELFRETVELRAAEKRALWDVTHIDMEDGPKIKLVHYQSRKGREGRRVEYLLDPERNHQIVYTAVWDKPEGTMTMERHKMLQQLPDGRWFPLKITQRMRERYNEWEFSDVQFNVSIDPSLFTMETFQYGMATTMLYRNSDGSESRMVFRNGKWVPKLQP